MSVTRAFRAGDVVELHLPMAPRFTAADPRIDAVRGCVAVERGPEVLCLESVDLPMAGVGAQAPDVALVSVDAAIAPREVDGRVLVRARVRRRATEPNWPYGADGADDDLDADDAPLDVPLIPYHDWANRGPSTMRVWIPRLGA